MNQTIHKVEVKLSIKEISKEICNELANAGKRVVIAGLEKDYQSEGFGSMSELLIDAEYITKVNAICMNCGDPANFSHRISSEKKQIVVGETDKYEALCRRCYNKSMEITK